MKKKWIIWVIIGVVVLIGIILLIVGAANKAAEEKQDQADRLADELDDDDYEAGQISDFERLNRKEIRKACRTCCRKGRTGIFGGRGRCRRECKAYGLANGLDAAKQRYCA